MVRQAVQKLFENSHFSICDLRNAMEIVGARKGGEAYTLLSALHCVDYAKMDPELRARIPQLVNECLLEADNIVDAADVALKGVL